MSGFFDDSDVERVRQAVDIAEVVGNYITLKRRGAGDYWARCPFHTEKTASFHVLSDRGMFHCFGCGKGGNVFTFLMEMEGVSFPEAVRMLAERAGIELPERAPGRTDQASRTERDRLFQANGLAVKWFHSRLVGTGSSPEAGRAFEYLKQRGIDLEIIRRYLLGWAEPGWDGLVSLGAKSGVSGNTLAQAGLALRRKDGSGFVDRFRARIMFPIHNLSGKPVAFGGRRLDGVTPDDDDAKYINSPETAVYRKGDNLYGLNVARDHIRREGFTFLVEGYTDLLALVQADVQNAVASLGTSLTQAQAKLLGRFVSRVYVVYDSDTAGVAAAVRAADVLTLAGLEVRLIRLPEGEDPDSLLHKDNGKERLLKTLKQDSSFVQFGLETARVDLSKGQAERIGTARSLLETIRNVTDPLQRELLLTELSEAIEIRREALDKALAGLRSRREEATSQVQHTYLTVPPESIAERDLVRALLGHPELTVECLVDLPVESIRHPSFRELYSTLERAHLRGEAIETSSLPERFNEPEVRAFIAEAVIAGQTIDNEQASHEVRGCLAALKRNDLQRRAIKIEEQIGQARREGRSTTDLMRELVDLKRQLRDISSD